MTQSPPSPVVPLRERPILFSAPMVRALLDGTKTQTRRIAKLADYDGDTDADGWPLVPVRESGCLVRAACPYGVPGDRLWVKESIRRDGDPDGPERWCRSGYIADNAPTAADCWPWKNRALPSIHCPRGLSRILLEVTSVRVERLQDISEDDAKAEGVTLPGARHICQCETDVEEISAEHAPTCAWRDTDFDPCGERHVDEFAHLWNAINRKRAPWSTNPWVWVVAFKRVAAERRAS